MANFQTGGGLGVLPPVVKNLLIINVLLFLAAGVSENSLGINLQQTLGLHWIGSSQFRWYQIFTYMFMHANFNHILFNMFAVWMFGSAIENIWGSKRFIIYYLITGICAAVLHYAILYFGTLQDFNHLIDTFLQNPNGQNLNAFFTQFKIEISSGSRIESIFQEAQPYLYNVLNGSTATQDVEKAYDFMDIYKGYYLNLPNVVGASGSLFGILLAFGMMFPNAELFLMFIPIPIKAKYFVIGYGAIELISGIMNNPNDNVAHFAHLGGFIGGYILIKFWQKFDSTFRFK